LIMSNKVKKTRPELLKQRRDLQMFERFLPTLQLKKQQLQTEILILRQEQKKLEEQMELKVQESTDWAELFGGKTPGNPANWIRVKNIKRGVKNIAGIKLPTLSDLEYETAVYSRFATPPWVDAGLEFLKTLMELREKLAILRKQEEILRDELRKVTQRVNLFEKVKIPGSKENIRLIRIALAEEQTSAVSRSKIAKSKSSVEVN